MRKSENTFKNPTAEFRFTKYFFGAALIAITSFPHFGGHWGKCQNIGVNTTGAAPNAANLFEVLQPSTTANTVGIYVSHSGAITGYALQALKTGAGVNNIAAYLSATGGTNNYALIVPASSGIIGFGTTAPTSTALLTINPTTNAVRDGIDITLSGATSTATGISVSTGNSNVNGITVTHSSSATSTSLYGIGGVLSSTNIVSGYSAYRNSSGLSYGIYGINGTSGTYATNADTWAAFLRGRTVISSESSPTSPLGTDLEIRNTTTGAGNPATVSLRQTTASNTNGDVLANLNFGAGTVTGPQAQIQVLRDATGGAGDLPAAFAFSTTPDASSTIAERMRISSDGQLGLNTTNPNRMGNSSDRTLSIESSNSPNVELLRITSAANSTLGTLNFDRIAAANGAITARTCIVGTTVNGTTDSRLEFHTMGTPSSLTERMRITETGNVGIGTTAPLSRLQVYNTNPSFAVNTTSFLNPALTANQAFNIHSSWNEVRASSGFNFGMDIYATVNRAYVDAAQTGSVNSAYGATNDAYIYSTGTTTNAIGSVNYVSNFSTGTITNAYGLQSNVVNPGGGTITNAYGLYVGAVTGTNKWGVYSNDAGAINYFAANVGIGVSSPNARLDVKGTGNTNASYGFGVRNSDDVYNLVVANNGFIGIGTFPSFAAPERMLHLHSTSNNFHAIRLTAENTANNWDIIKRGNTYAQPENFVIAYNNNEWFQIDPSGNVGILINTPLYALDVAGTTRSTSGFWDASDFRFKKDIRFISSALPNLLKLQGVTYFWKKDEFPELKFDDNLQYGVIAQDLEKIFPELVHTDGHGFKSVSYSKLTPLLIEAIKEQQKMIEELKIINDNQQSSINQLHSEISEIKNALGLVGKK